MGPSKFPDELSAQAQSCATFLMAIEDLLKKSNRNFDAAVVQTCIDLIHRDFIRKRNPDNVIRFAKPAVLQDTEDKP
jgi:hypothetical protein